MSKIVKDYAGDNTKEQRTIDDITKQNLRATLEMFIFFLMVCAAAFFFQSTINGALVQMSHTTMKCVKVEIYEDGYYKEGSCDNIPKKHEIIWVK